MSDTMIPWSSLPPPEAGEPTRQVIAFTWPGAPEQFVVALPPHVTAAAADAIMAAVDAALTHGGLSPRVVEAVCCHRDPGAARMLVAFTLAMAIAICGDGENKGE